MKDRVNRAWNEICDLRDYMDYMYIAWRERGIKHQCIKWIIIIIIEWSVGRRKEHHLIIPMLYGVFPMLYGVFPMLYGTVLILYGVISSTWMIWMLIYELIYMIDRDLRIE